MEVIDLTDDHDEEPLPPACIDARHRRRTASNLSLTPFTVHLSLAGVDAVPVFAGEPRACSVCGMDLGSEFVRVVSHPQLEVAVCSPCWDGHPCAQGGGSVDADEGDSDSSGHADGEDESTGGQQENNDDMLGGDGMHEYCCWSLHSHAHTLTRALTRSLTVPC